MAVISFPCAPELTVLAEQRADAARLVHIIAAHPEQVAIICGRWGALPADRDERAATVRAAIDAEMATWRRLGKTSTPYPSAPIEGHTA